MSLDERIVRRARPYVDASIDSQPAAFGAALRALVDAYGLRFDYQRDADHRLFLAFGVVDDAGNAAAFVLVNAHNVGVWEAAGALVYMPDPVLDDDIPTVPVDL